MIGNPYTGDVMVSFDERQVIFKFTWRSRAILRAVFGENWIDQISAAIITRDASILATIVDTITDGQISHDELLNSDYPLSDIANAIRQSFKFSHHGFLEPEDKNESPKIMKRQETKLPLLLKLQQALGLVQKNFGA